MLKKIVLLTAALFISTSLLFSEGYVIANVDYVINGITREKNLERKLPVNKTKVFENEEQLQNYIDSLTQKFVNLRIFDHVEISYLKGNKEEEAPSPVFLTIKVIDSKKFVAVPYYKYDSNDGHILKAKLKDSNFLGTVNEMSSDIYFGINNNSNDVDFSLGASFAYKLPFYIGIIEASWNNDLDASYTFGKDIPEWKCNTGFTFRIPFESFALELNLTQKFVNDFDYKIYNDPLYFGEEINFGVPIILQSTKMLGDIIYTPGVSYVYNWSFHELNLRNDDLLSPELLFSNKISFSNINWNGNFRKGASFYARQDAGYNYHINDMVIGIESELQTFFSWKYTGINSRLYGFSYMNKNKTVSNRLRGISDKEFYNSDSFNDINSSSTPSAIVLNLDIPIHLFDISFGDKKVLRNLAMEVQASPFVDFALTHNRVTGRMFDLKDSYLCGGFEVIVYPHKFKSLQIRGSAGLDLTRLLMKNYIDESWRPKVSPYEISFGLGLHY